jgi:hypothetical protein
MCQWGHNTKLKRLLNGLKGVETNHSGMFCSIAIFYEQTDEFWQHGLHGNIKTDRCRFVITYITAVYEVCVFV